MKYAQRVNPINGCRISIKQWAGTAINNIKAFNLKKSRPACVKITSR
jgi:hypothetical protein